MSILKRHVNSSSIFVSSFIVMTLNSSVNINLIHFYFGQKIPSKSQFWHFRVLCWKSAKFLTSFFKPQVSFSSNFASLFSVMKDDSSTVLAQTLYPLVTRSPLKCTLFRLLSARVKFVNFLMSNLKRQVNSSSIFVSFFIVMTHDCSVKFNLMHFPFWTKESHQSSNFDTFECSGKYLPNSSCHFPNHKQFFLKFCIRCQCHER